MQVVYLTGRPVAMFPSSLSVGRECSIRSYASSVVRRFNTCRGTGVLLLRPKFGWCVCGPDSTPSFSSFTSSSFSSSCVSAEPGWEVILLGSGNGSYPTLGETTSPVSFSRNDTSTELEILRGSAGCHSLYDLRLML